MSNDKHFVQGALTCMREFMAADGNKNIFQTHIEPLVNDTSFSRITDRRVMGSMNDFIFQAKVYLNMGKSPLDVSFLLNESPMSYLKYGRPKDAFKYSVTLLEGF
jgi:hypothetical protein